MADVFSVVAMFILFREALEASVIISIMLQMCDRLKLKKSKRQVWLGAGSGIALTLIIGTVFIVVFYVARTRAFSGVGQQIFKGYINLVAAYLIAVLAFAMLRFMNYEKKWERKLSAAAARVDEERSNKWALFFLAFTCIIREGLESVVFLAGVSSSVPITSIPLAGFVGILLGILCGLALYYTGKSIRDIAWFFVLSCVLLFFIAAGLVSKAMTAWQSIGWFGTVWPAYARPWWNKPLWDTSGCCSDDVSRNKFFGLMGALFGYSATPTFISIFAYFGFWAIMVFDFVMRWRRGSLTDAFKGKLAEPLPSSPELAPADSLPNPKELGSETSEELDVNGSLQGSEAEPKLSTGAPTHLTVSAL